MLTLCMHKVVNAVLAQIAPSDEGYLRQDKTTAEMHTLCMHKVVNAVLTQHRSL